MLCLLSFVEVYNEVAAIDAAVRESELELFHEDDEFVPELCAIDIWPIEDESDFDQLPTFSSQNPLEGLFELGWLSDLSSPSRVCFREWIWDQLSKPSGSGFCAKRRGAISSRGFAELFLFPPR